MVAIVSSLFELLQSVLNVRYHVGQVAGRLHVEVIRVAGGFQDSVGGGEEGDSSPDTDNQDRKLVCMVSTLCTHSLTHTANTHRHTCSFWKPSWPSTSGLQPASLGLTFDPRVALQLKILQATGLPQYLSNFVFCQYSFWDQPEPIIVAPEVDTSTSSPGAKDPHCMVVFDSCKVGCSLFYFFFIYIQTSIVS